MKYDVCLDGQHYLVESEIDSIDARTKAFTALRVDESHMEAIYLLKELPTE